MSHDPDAPEVIASFTNEVDASVLVSMLEESGLKAQSVGGFTAGFRAEAPGEVGVVVRRADLERAQAVLADFKRRMADHGEEE